MHPNMHIWHIWPYWIWIFWDTLLSSLKNFSLNSLLIFVFLMSQHDDGGFRNLSDFKKSSEKLGMKATAILPTPSLRVPTPPATSTMQNTDSARTIPVW